MVHTAVNPVASTILRSPTVKFASTFRNTREASFPSLDYMFPTVDTQNVVAAKLTDFAETFDKSW